MDVGKNIKQLRELKNLTQAHVASHLNMSVGGYSKIESGQTDVSFSKIQQIAEVLETDLGTILNFDPKNIFNLCHNNNSVVTGSVSTQNNHEKTIDLLNEIKSQITTLKEQLKNN